jgi:hypothetical protein
VKVDVMVVLKNLQGEALKDSDKEATLRSVATAALMLPYQDEQSVGGEEKFTRYKLALRINASESVELTPEEAAKVKQLIGKAFGPAVVGPAYELLNG